MGDLTKALRTRENWRDNPRSAPYLQSIMQVAKANNLPPDIIGNMAHVESSFNPNAVSPAGAMGLMQIMPSHHPKANVKDPVASMNYAAGYLNKLQSRFGSMDKALAAYNFGPGNVRRLESRYGANWLAHAPKETQDYLFKVLGPAQPVIPPELFIP